MGKLIYADKLKADLEKAISKNEDMDCLDFLRAASVIDAQPTAYDPDKVVEQLETRKTRAAALQKASEYFEGETDAFEVAIKIVKDGES